MQGPRRVCGAVEVLCSRIAQIDMVWVDNGAVSYFGLIMDHGSTAQVRREQLLEMAHQACTYLAPVDDIVGKERPTKFFCFDRSSSSLSAAVTSSNTAFLLTSWSSSQAK